MTDQPLTCQTCGHTDNGPAYHPYAFCVLYKAGLNPWEVVFEAADHETEPVMVALGATPAIRMGGLAPAWYPQDDEDEDEPDGWIVPINQ